MAKRKSESHIVISQALNHLTQNNNLPAKPRVVILNRNEAIPKTDRSVLNGESRERFNELHHSLLSEIEPATPIENLLVSRMAVAQWRQLRLWSLEKSTVEAEPGTLLERASIFEARYDRQFDRALATIERRRDAKTRPEPTTHTKQKEIPPPPTQEPPAEQPART